MVWDEHTLYAVKKVDFSWSTKKSTKFLAAIFTDQTLDINKCDDFNISKYIDFIIYKHNIYISKKKQFESILNYKAQYHSEFISLTSEEEFKGIFANIDELLDFVGTNKMQLRRSIAIKQKGYYKNKNFMENLRLKYKDYKLNISFDGSGKIIPSLDNCKDIFQALLDHRLISGLSNNIYDVPDTSKVPS